MVRLGDGTDESHRRMQAALDALWPYTGEMFLSDEKDASRRRRHRARPGEPQARVGGDGPRRADRGDARDPGHAFAHKGGKRGVHTEHLGYILADMQFLQRAYPGATW